ncbi:polyhydroxyalkanoate synthesis regulator phasin [Deinococcus metalli]|uniref:Polyhydroxyalkanoate synthesis regulator phasin n=1 Tax=Deinococcus metalli TaxID=1141878 RepID=A0A7W8KIP7_9DEIO|nr:S-layer homology domain-containing protein [Deinococcus metalli]MBB5378897.1 polyhydroxyalkanoate synthesis regulator phasin [Deinococcus metalli]GHF62581.1 S-layer protein SlpA [Deinococcus metalli]
MKKSLLILTAALSFGMASAQTEAPASAPQVPNLTDVPAGHWAKDAIDKLVSRGIILGYPDGTYRGTQNLTRYEAAVIIARLLDQIRTGETPASSIDADTLAALQNAIQELAADLAALGVRVSDLEDNAVSKDDFTRLENRVEEIASSQGDAEALANLQSQIDELTTRADDYDTLRADVDDNASSIAALNDLTVLLNQDILNLQDRVSAVEAAQADLVQRADFDALSGRVSTVETKVTSLDNRVTQLEKYAFSIKPSLSATYYVARSARNMDFDRLLPGTVFSTGDDGDADTSDAPRDYADMTGSRVAIGNAAANNAPTALNFYGFSTTVQVDADGNPLTPGTVESATPSAVSVNVEGSTSIDFSIDFSNSGNKFSSSKSAVTGAYVPSAGSLNVNAVDISFGIRAGLPDSDYISAADYANYPDVTDTDSGITYRPLFFYFNNATAYFTVGNAPITVTFGQALKFHFADYIGDNDKTGRGDGFNVNIDGSTVPVIGAFKPTLQFVYGSRGGANGDYQYYRGVRATITPVGTLKAGVHVLQEGLDYSGAALGAAGPSDVTAFGADLHGTVAGWQLDSEYAMSRVTDAGVTSPESAFYAKTAGSLGPVKVYTLNYRSISAGYDKVAGISEADPTDTDNGSTAPYAADQTGFGVKVAGTLGPISIGGYWDNQVAFGSSPFDTATDPTAIVDRGAYAKVSLFNLVTLRGGYNEYLAGPTAGLGAPYDGENGVRYNVRVDVTPGLGIGIGAYYRNLTINGTKAQNDGGLFANGKYNSYFPLTGNDFTDQSGCGDQHPGIKSTDVDGVGRALTFTQNSFADSYCYSEFGADLTHNGKDANALVKDLSFRIGYASRYRNATAAYSNSYIFGDVLYGKKLGPVQVDVKGAVGVDRYADQATDNTAANSTAFAVGVKAMTDPLDIIFKPSFEGQFGYYSRAYDYDASSTSTDYTATGLKYLAGVKFNDFLLPNTKLAVYYAGYRGQNRVYQPYAYTTNVVNGGSDLAGRFADSNTGATVQQNLLYVEGNYYDLSVGYGYGTLSLTDNASGAAVQPTASGSVFKINYKVSF